MATSNSNDAIHTEETRLPQWLLVYKTSEIVSPINDFLFQTKTNPCSVFDKEATQIMCLTNAATKMDSQLCKTAEKYYKMEKLNIYMGSCVVITFTSR